MTILLGLCLFIGLVGIVVVSLPYKRAPLPRAEIKVPSQDCLEKGYSILFFQTETTGLFPENTTILPSVEDMPRLIRLSWLACDQYLRVQKREVLYVNEIESIPEASQAIHGISASKLQQKGSPLAHVLENFCKDIGPQTLLVAHNEMFHESVLRCEFFRLSRQRVSIPFPLPNRYQTFCTMEFTTDVCKIPSPNGRGYKYPRLTELQNWLPSQKTIHLSRENRDKIPLVLLRVMNELVRRKYVQITSVETTKG